MTQDQFCYWLQGFSELNQAPPTAEQWKSIQDHLKLVFTKVTPSIDWYKVNDQMARPLDPLRVTC